MVSPYLPYDSSQIKFHHSFNLLLYDWRSHSSLQQRSKTLSLPYPSEFPNVRKGGREGNRERQRQSDRDREGDQVEIREEKALLLKEHYTAIKNPVIN